MRENEILGQIVSTRDVLQTQLLTSILETTRELTEDNKKSIKNSITAVVSKSFENLVDRIQKG